MDSIDILHKIVTILNKYVSVRPDSMVMLQKSGNQLEMIVVNSKEPYTTFVINLKHDLKTEGIDGVVKVKGYNIDDSDLPNPNSWIVFKYTREGLIIETDT